MKKIYIFLCITIASLTQLQDEQRDFQLLLLNIIVNAGELAQNIFDQNYLNPNENNNGELIDCLMGGHRHSFEHMKEGTVRFRSKMVRSMRCVKGKTHHEPTSVMTSEV